MELDKLQNKINRLKLEDLLSGKIGILGLGIENLALIDFLIAKKVDCEITVCDFRTKERLGERFKKFSRYKNIKWKLGVEFNLGLEEFDILMRSPGWSLKCPGIQGAVKAKKLKDLEIGKFVYSPMKLFFDLCPTRNIIGVTGTKGKGTTSSLIYEIIKASGRKVFLGGNIGVAPFEFISNLKKEDFVVLELSSFQLEDLHKSPRIAVFVNFSRDHLAPADPNNSNFHKTMRDYWEAKINIFIHQKRGDKIILSKKLEVKSKKLKLKNRIIFFDKSKLESGLVGEHNKENIAAAVETAKILRIKKDVVAKAVKRFKGLEHRIEFAGEKNGVKYYDDSFATTPDSAITALKSFDAPIVLLAGGSDKGSDFKSFAKSVKKKVKFVILFKGLGSDRIKKALLETKYEGKNIKTVSDMASAMKIAGQKSQAGDIVLLTPACASFGVFKNYKERGEQFKLKVESL